VTAGLAIYDTVLLRLDKIYNADAFLDASEFGPYDNQRCAQSGIVCIFSYSYLQPWNGCIYGISPSRCRRAGEKALSSKCKYHDSPYVIYPSCGCRI
jgi:hypothetical protein